jgi:hypothetical protein
MVARLRPHAVRGAVLAAAFSSALLGTVLLLGNPASAGRADPQHHDAACARRPPTGSGEHAAERVVELYLRTVVAGRAACIESRLSVAGLDPARYETSRPASVEGWWQLAPRIRNPRGLWEYAGFMWLDAVDAEPAAFEFLLELHGRRWLVSSFELAPGSAEVNFGNAPS